jgi:hypothetical protein
MGSPEADTRKEVNFYFSGDTWTWRGWAELGRLLSETGDAATAERGRLLLAECERYGADIEASIRESVRRSEQGVFVPPVAGFDKPFETMTQDRFASYTNYRYWIEMISSGCLRPEWQDAIIDYRVAHGGELLGTARFQGHLDDWPFAGHGYGLLLRDRVDRFLLGFYGDLAMHRMRGTFTAYEQASIRGPAKRSYVADYCVPAQLVTPLLAKWMLVFEERDADVLWLCRATPRRWLGPDGGVAVRHAATRWGPVDFTISPSGDGSINAQIELPRPDFPAEIRLRLRAPDAQAIRHVVLNGRPHKDIDVEGEYIRVVRPSERRLRLACRRDDRVCRVRAAVAWPPAHARRASDGPLRSGRRCAPRDLDRGPEGTGAVVGCRGISSMVVSHLESKGGRLDSPTPKTEAVARAFRGGDSRGQPEKEPFVPFFTGKQWPERTFFGSCNLRVKERVEQ